MRVLLKNLFKFFALLKADTFALCVLAAVAAAAVLAFVFGADGHLIIGLLGLGVLTALLETSIRARMDHGGRK